jgi:uncharacterized membrane protein YoaK (UPF0700 family)
MVLTAGCVDAIGYHQSQIFPANMTGNAVMLAASLVESCSWDAMSHPALTLLFFCTGAFLAALFLKFFPNRKTMTFGVIFLAGAVLCFCGISLLSRMPYGEFTFSHLLLISMAMGMQSAGALAMKVIPGAGISTVITSTITASISHGAEWLRQKILGKGQGEASLSFFPKLVVVCYFLGAVAGVIHPGLNLGSIILLAGCLLTISSLVMALFPSTEGPKDEIF